jgi:hypothetical protein
MVQSYQSSIIGIAVRVDERAAEATIKELEKIGG